MDRTSNRNINSNINRNRKTDSNLNSDSNSSSNIINTNIESHNFVSKKAEVVEVPLAYKTKINKGEPLSCVRR